MKTKLLGITATVLLLLSICMASVVSDQVSDGYEGPRVGESFRASDGNEYRFAEVDAGNVVEFSRNNTFSGDVTIPAFVKDSRPGPHYPVRGIGAGAFMDSNIRTVDMTNIQWIDTAAFAGSTIESLQITSNLKWISGNVIVDCSNFKTLTFENVDNLSLKSDHVFCSMNRLDNGGYEFVNYKFVFTDESEHVFTNDTVKLFSNKTFKWNSDESCFEETSEIQNGSGLLGAMHFGLESSGLNYGMIIIGAIAIIVLFGGLFALRTVKK